MRQGVSLHALRRTFGSLVVRRGGDLMSVWEALGYADVSTTSIHPRLDAAYLQEGFGARSAEGFQRVTDSGVKRSGREKFLDEHRAEPASFGSALCFGTRSDYSLIARKLQVVALGPTVMVRERGSIR